MPNIPPIESVRLMMPQSALWPQGLEWGLHDFTLAGAQGGREFLDIIEQDYGGAKNAEEWIELAQFVNYEGYRAMFEAQGKDRAGLLLWMSHPCWPSFVWQTYDYYFEPTAAYFGCKKGIRAAAHPVEPLCRHGGGGELQRGQREGPERARGVAEYRWRKDAGP